MFYWRVNKSGLTSVDYVAKYEMIVTASVHGNVRLWTLNGVMIGTFGQGRTLTTARTPWRLNDESTYSCLEPASPLTEEELYPQAG